MESYWGEKCSEPAMYPRTRQPGLYDLHVGLDRQAEGGYDSTSRADELPGLGSPLLCGCGWSGSAAAFLDRIRPDDHRAVCTVARGPGRVSAAQCPRYRG